MRLSSVVPASSVPTQPDPQIAQPDLLDIAFRRNIAALTSGRQNPPAVDDQRRCGRELDGLALDPGRPSGVKALNLALMRLVRPTRTVAAVVSAKNEGCFLLEWVAHCRAVGFEHIFIYTNDNTDGSDALLDALDRTEFVTVLRNDVGSLASPQVKAYEHSIHLLRALRNFEWVAYFDVDEFLIPAALYDHSVIETLAAFKLRHPHQSGSARGRSPSAICYNWHSYGSGGEIRQRDGLVQERFTHSIAYPMFKSLVRLADIETMALIHMPGPEGLAFVNAAFDPITVGFDCSAAPPDPVHGRLNHYYQKSFEEFGIKSSRGRGGAPGGLEGKGFDTFFAWDVPNIAANYNPTPPGLLARLRDELATLLAVPAIAAAAHQACEAQRALSHRVNGGDVEARFHEMQEQFHHAA